MVYAPTGVGKSFFALACALAVAGGGRAFGWEAMQPRKVLFVDGEMDREDISERGARLIRTLPGLDAKKAGKNLNFLAYQDQDPKAWFPMVTDEDGQQFIADSAHRLGADLVVIDNLSTLARVEDENASASIDPVIDLLMLLKRHGMAVMVVHHARKNNVGEGSYRGSQKLSVTFQSIIRLQHPDGVPSYDGVSFDLSFEKVRGLRTEETDDLRASLPATGERVDETSGWQLEVRGDARLRRLVALVRSMEHATQEDLAEALDVSTGTLTATKRKAFRQGLISPDEWRRCMQQARELADEEQVSRSENDVPF